METVCEHGTERANYNTYAQSAIPNSLPLLLVTLPLSSRWYHSTAVGAVSRTQWNIDRLDI